MNNEINISGANGGGSSVKIYETADYNYSRRGACVMHGSYTVGPSSPDSQRIEIVELQLPVLSIRVKADDVKNHLRALIEANMAWEKSRWSVEFLAQRDRAFEALYAAVLSLAGSSITLKHIQLIVNEAFQDGVRHGGELVQVGMRKMLGL